MAKPNELDMIFHDLSKNVRREKLILDELIDKYQRGSLEFNCEEIIDFVPTMKKVEENIDKLNELLKRSIDER